MRPQVSHPPSFTPKGESAPPCGRSRGRAVTRGPRPALRCPRVSFQRKGAPPSRDAAEEEGVPSAHPRV